MTINELNQLQWINKEILYYERQIRFMKSDVYKSHTSTEEIEQMNALLEIAKQRRWMEKNTLEIFIDTIADSKLRLIMRLRFINCYTWLKIAFEIGAHDESVPRKAVERFLKGSK